MTTKTDFPKILSEIQKLKASLHSKDFLLTWDKSVEELKLVMLVAEALKCLRESNISTRCFDSGLAVSIKNLIESFLRNSSRSGSICFSLS